MLLEVVGIITLLSLFLFDASIGSSNLNVSKTVHGRSKPPLSIRYPDGESGYCNISNVKGERMFYYFFNKRSVEGSPVMLWLIGEMGISVGVSIFKDNGPYAINGNGNLNLRKYGWDKIANIIYVDQPIGTGYSFLKKDSKIRHNGDEVVNDLYNFLQEFFKIHYEYKDSDFLIAGQSYAGRYVPMLGEKIYKENENTRMTGHVYIHLKGISIGSGLTSPQTQFKWLPRYCETINVDQTEFQKVTKMKDEPEFQQAHERCTDAIQSCDSTGEDIDCLKAYSWCEILFSTITKLTEIQTKDTTKKLNLFDIKKEEHNGLAYDFSDVQSYLNKESVKKALGVEIEPFKLINTVVESSMAADQMKNSEEYVAYLVNRNISVLIYAGGDNLINNWIGIYHWVINLQWDRIEEFEDAKFFEIVLDDDETHTPIANVIGVGPLKYCTIFKAGHMTAMDRPKETFTMMKAWIKDSLRSRTN